MGNSHGAENKHLMCGCCCFVLRQDGASVGRADGPVPAHARRPFRSGQDRGVLARRVTTGIGLRRHDGASGGRGQHGRITLL